MKRTVLALTIVSLFLVPTYAAAASCCNQAEKPQASSTQTSSQDRAGAPALAGTTVSGGTSQMAPETSQKKEPDQQHHLGKSEKAKN